MRCACSRPVVALAADQDRFPWPPADTWLHLPNSKPSIFPAGHLLPAHTVWRRQEPVGRQLGGRPEKDAARIAARVCVGGRRAAVDAGRGQHHLAQQLVAWGVPHAATLSMLDNAAWRVYWRVTNWQSMLQRRERRLARAHLQAGRM